MPVTTSASGSEDHTRLPPDATVLMPGVAGAEWYVFRTRPRREKKAAALLQDLGVPQYLPLRRNVTRKGRGRYSFLVPLFPGYVFGCCTPAQRLRAMRSGHMANWLEVVDQQQLLCELREVERVCERGLGLTLYPQLKRGRWVRVVTGPLAGVVGRISRRKECYRVVMNVSALGSAVATEVDMDDVVAVEPPELEAEEERVPMAVRWPT